MKANHNESASTCPSAGPGTHPRGRSQSGAWAVAVLVACWLAVALSPPACGAQQVPTPDKKLAHPRPAPKPADKQHPPSVATPQAPAASTTTVPSPQIAPSSPAAPASAPTQNNPRTQPPGVQTRNAPTTGGGGPSPRQPGHTQRSQPTRPTASHPPPKQPQASSKPGKPRARINAPPPILPPAPQPAAGPGQPAAAASTRRSLPVRLWRAARARPVAAGGVALLLVLVPLAAWRRTRRPRPRRSARPRGANMVPLGRGLLTLTNAQHQGARSQQQDAFAFSDPRNRQLAATAGVVGVVADGMGGLALGAQASQVAVQTFLREIERVGASGRDVAATLLDALHAANEAVVAVARAAGVGENAGTTLAAVAVGPDGVFWVAAGDTRAYLYRGGRLARLNADHNHRRTLAREAARGARAFASVDADPDAPALTSYLGEPRVREVDRNLRALRLRPGDRLLVCSDGLYGTLGEAGIERMLADAPEVPAQELVDGAVAAHARGQDNLTVIGIAFDEPSPGRGAPRPQRRHREAREPATV